MEENKEAVGYCRVSTHGQVEGHGYDRQREAIRHFAKQAGLSLVTIYEESISGTEEDRPVFNEMLLNLLDGPGRVIVIESLDRLARDLQVSMTLLSKLAAEGVTLYSAATGADVTASMTDNPMGKALTQIQGCFAELDKSLLIRRLRKAREHVRETTGKCEGRKPYGTRPGEFKTLERMKQLNRKPRDGKRRGPHTIARILNDEGLLARSGRPWSGVSVKRILDRG